MRRPSTSASIIAKTGKGTGFKAQLAAPSKLVALKYKKCLDEFGKVTAEVIMSAPDTREEQEDVAEVDTEEAGGDASEKASPARHCGPIGPKWTHESSTAACK